MQLLNKKSTGYNGITADLVKKIADNIVSKFFNRSIPGSPNVVPTLKAPNNYIDNTCPISLV